MSTKVRARTRLMVAFAATAAMMFTLMPASPASAGQFTGVVVGTAILSGPLGTCGTGNFHGDATGLHGNATAAGDVHSTNFNYCNPDVVTGTANGTVIIDLNGSASHSCPFTWTRTGAIAVVILTTCHTAGTVVAEFAPVPGTPPGDNVFKVVAEGIL